MTLTKTAVAVCSLLPLFSAAAPSPIETITVQGYKPKQQDAALTIAQAQANPTSPDVSRWLYSVPGANVNNNGALSGIAQYRGHYGARIATNVNGITMAGAGPNAMDTPLSYSPTIMLDSMQVYRTLAPVSAGIDTLGGAISVQQKQGELHQGWQHQLLGNVQHKGNNYALAGRTSYGNKHYALAGYIEQVTGNTRKSGNGTDIANSDYKRLQYGLSGIFALKNGHINGAFNRTDTGKTGTAALPMDIDYIDTERYQLGGEHTLSGWDINWQFAYQDARHGMDNFSQRHIPSPKKARYTTAISDSYNAKVHLSNNHWQWGYDAISSTHTATIANPNNSMFSVVNFNHVKEARHSVFVQYTPVWQRLSTSIGLRVKYNQADADNVSSSMAMMMPAVNTLQTRFNQADKRVSDTTFDMNLVNRYQLSNTVQINYGLAVKQRAPQYQARYLWLPMQATGGLADGRTYIGNINLKPETAYQGEMGITWQHKKWQLSPQFFIHEVDNYIQGMPSEDKAANMVSNMMASKPSLQFSNIDARLYGADIHGIYTINPQWSVRGQLSYVRGKQTKSADNLYRIAPLNGQASVQYQQDNWQLSTTLVAYAKQSKVSAINHEKPSAGYGLMNVKFAYYLGQNWLLTAGVDNLFNKYYTPHLAGTNRAAGKPQQVGEKLPATGRNLYLGVQLDY